MTHSNEFSRSFPDIYNWKNLYNKTIQEEVLAEQILVVCMHTLKASSCTRFNLNISTYMTSQCPTVRSSWRFVVVFFVDQQQSSYQLVKLFLYWSWLCSQWAAKHQLPWSKTHLHKLDLPAEHSDDGYKRQLHKSIHAMVSIICNPIISYPALLKRMAETRKPASRHMLHTQAGVNDHSELSSVSDCDSS